MNILKCCWGLQINELTLNRCKKNVEIHIGSIFDIFYIFIFLWLSIIGFSHFIDQIDLHGMEVDIALRHTLSFFRLPGEAQKIERIMQVCN